VNKDLKPLLARVVRQGFAVRIARSGHYRVSSPAGGTVTVARTPRAGGLAKVRADLKRIGARL
jgi:hypothetical protein